MCGVGQKKVKENVWRQEDIMGSGIAEKIYSKSPLWLQNTFVSLKGLDFRYRRANDTLIHDYFQSLLSSQNWPLEKFRENQVWMLQKILRIAFCHVPYYRTMQKSLGCEPEDFKQPEDIRLLPILTKSQVRGQEKLFLNETINPKQCIRGFTSGTTGTPLNIFETQESFSLRWAFVERLRFWAGLENPHYTRRAQFTGRNIVPFNQRPDTHVYWRWNRPGNALLFSTTHLSPETVPYYADALCAFKPELIDGYPSAMLIIARVSRRLGITLPSVKSIIVSAETLLPEHRRELEEAFNCRVHNQYASSEPSCFWCDCEHGIMHENPECAISEIVNQEGMPAKIGEPGEVVVTSLLNPMMILLRYKLGDLAIWSKNSQCSCGRAMPQVESVQGRVDDILFVPGRGYVGRLDPVFKGLSNIIEAQIIQETLEHIHVLLVPDERYNENIRHHLEENIREKLGNTVDITIEEVKSIPRGANGKFRSVLSNVRHLYPDQM
jgi:phenylacetate-CoA ligase